MSAESFPSVKINTIVNPVKTVSRRARFCFVALFALLSINYGFLPSGSLKAKFFTKLWYLTEVSVVSFILSNYFLNILDDFSLSLWYLKYVCEFCIMTFAFNIFVDKSFFDFWRSLITIDTKLGYLGGIRKTDFIAFAMTFCSLTSRILSSVCYCTFYEEYCIASYLARFSYLVPLLCMDSFLIMYFIIFFSMYCRLKVFVQYIKNSNADVNNYQHLYKYMVDRVESGKCVFDYVVSDKTLRNNVIRTTNKQ
jgi:hypothetical protein